MDDFMQWAMNTLQHQQQHPTPAAAAYVDAGDVDSAAAAAFPSLQAFRNSSQPPQTAGAAAVGFRDLTVQVDHRANSFSSGDSPGAAAAAGWSSPHTARARNGGGGSSSTRSSSKPMSWNFGAALAQPTGDLGGGGAAALDVAVTAPAVATPAPGKRGGSRGGTSAAAGSSGQVQDHIIAERRRREKINQRFIELSTVIPGLKKMDKATILGDAVNYVKGLQEKVKSLEDDHNASSSSNTHSVVFVNKPCFTDVEGSPSSVPVGSGLSSGDSRLPEIEARRSEKSVLLRIHCENTRGMLVRVLAKVEELHLSITHTSVMPFPSCTVIITITAKVEEGFNSTVEEIVTTIHSALHQYYSSSSEETGKI